MDILDTFGDWVQLFLAIGGFWFINGFMSGMVKNILWPVILCSIMWGAVYDYDLVIGYLIGGIISGGLGANALFGTEFSSHLDSAFSTQLWGGFGVAVIMITKMVLFW